MMQITKLRLVSRVSTSGGQKQRISVARAMYSSNDVVLLDDPLSALDVHVGSHMFFKGILDFLIEERRTVVLVTHQVQYLEHADQVIFLQNGCVARKGTMREIGKLDPSLVESWNLSLKAANEAELEVGYCSSTDEEREVLKKQISTIKKDQRPQNDDSSSKLIESEERNRGSVSYRYYWYYLCQFGLCPGFFVCFFAILQNVAQAGTQFWLSVWSSAGAKLPSNATDEESNALLMRYIGVYCALNAADMVLCMVWTMILLFQCVQTSKNLHNLMLTRVLRAPMRFFDTTPIDES
ncbi:ATP-binding cassette sub-family C member 9-like [Strongylocentrotus purpuratus]|uniref:ABC transmembrane type-1 domain-containing protein n=1 Tax=Strongylocentrotus purpuratus TaxID=7668 RepID=A0A7M7PVC9_STRPU|nr:ATP-binding cassette sub-family C member 9-like [Strongylocentrotus purpuratus]